MFYREHGIIRKIYWRLPYNIRRAIFKITYPELYQKYMQDRMPHNIENRCDFHIFLQRKCIFIHIPKTGGISISKSLFEKRTGGHTPISQYAIILNKREFKSFFKFSFVRNPWDRLVSAYFYLKQGGRNKYDNDWAIKHLSAYKDFNTFVLNWVNKDNIFKGIHFLPQYTFLTFPGNTKPVIDFIGRYENLYEDYSYIKNKLGFGNALIMENKTKNKNVNYLTYYTDTMIEIVQDVYKKDIDLFGYRFE